MSIQFFPSVYVKFCIEMGDGRKLEGVSPAAEIVQDLWLREHRITIRLSECMVHQQLNPANQPPAPPAKNPLLPSKPSVALPKATSPGHKAEDLGLWLDLCSDADRQQWSIERYAIDEYLAKVSAEIGVEVEVSRNH